MGAERISPLTGDTLALLRAQAPPWVPGTPKGHQQGHQREVSFPALKEPALLRSPAAAPQAPITFFGVKAHPFVLHGGPGTRHCPRALGRGQQLAAVTGTWLALLSGHRSAGPAHGNGRC